MIKIPMADKNSFVMNASLDGMFFILKFDWNQSFNYWTMGIADPDNNPINTFVLVPNTPMLKRWRYLPLPAGDFVVDAQRGASLISRKDFVNGRCSLLYIKGDEIGSI